MGLDSYLYVSDHPISHVFEIIKSNEICYWRKNYDLNSEVSRISEAIISDSILLVNLTAKDMDKLQVYFDGQEQALSKAQAALKNGRFLYYYGSW